MAHTIRYLIFRAAAAVYDRRFIRGGTWVGGHRPPLQRSILFVVAGCLLLASSLRAQPTEIQPIRFSVFSARPIAGLEFVSRPDAASQKIVFYPTARSPRYEYRGAMPLRFVEGKTGRTAAEAMIPPTITNALLLFTAIEPSPREGLSYQVAVLDDSAARHNAGGLAVINLSGLQLSGVVGRHAVILKPGLNPTLQIGTTAQIALRVAFKDRTYQSYADQLEIGANERALLILFPPYYSGSLEVQSRMLIDRPTAGGDATTGR